MKVLFAGKYNESETLNGPEKVAKRIFYQYSKNESSVFAEYFFDGRKHSFFKKLFGFEKVTKVNDSEVLRFGMLSLLSFLFKSKPEIIHIITYERFAVVCFIYKLFSKVRILYNVHGVISIENTEMNQTSLLYVVKDKIIEKIFMKYSDKLIFLSERSVELYKKILDFDSAKIEFIPNGIDEVFFKTGNKRKVNFENTLNLVFAGDEVRKEKGLEFLLNAVSRLNFDLNLFLIGNYSRTFENYSSKIIIKVTELMDTNDFSRFLEDKDIFVSASSYEQFSITAVETMAAGLAPIVTLETGMSSYIKNLENGITLNFGDEDLLTKSIERLNSDRNLLSILSENAKSIYGKLSWEKVFERYKTLYK